MKQIRQSITLQFNCEEMSKQRKDRDSSRRDKNVTLKQASVSAITTFDKAHDSNHSSKSGLNNTNTSMLAPKMSGEFQTVQAVARADRFRSSSQGGEDLERQGNLPKLPAGHFDHVPGQIHVGGNAITGPVMKIENEARIPQRQTHQQAKGPKSRMKEAFGLQNSSLVVNSQFKTSFNADLNSSPMSVPQRTNSERKKSLQQANSMLNAEQSRTVSKRLVLMKEGEASEGRLVAGQNTTVVDPLKGKLGDSHGRGGSSLEQTAKLHELSREHLKVGRQKFPGIHGASATALKGQNQNHMEAVRGRASASQLKLKKNAGKGSPGSPGSFNSMGRNSMDQGLLFLQAQTEPDFILPNVHQASAANIRQTEANELSTEDFNLSASNIDPLQSGYNRIQFKKGKKSMNLSKEGLHRHQVKQSQRDTLRLVRKQNDKFNLYSSLDDPTSNMTSMERKNHRINTTYDTSAMASVASKPSLRLAQTQSVAQFHSQSQLNATSSLVTLKNETHNVAAEAERRRLKKESSKLELLEMEATEGKNSGNLTLDQVHSLGQNYIKSLQTIMVNVSEKGSNQSAEMQNFIANLCKGIEFTTSTHTKLQQEGIAKVQKQMQAQDSYVKRLEEEVAELKDELKLRPYQTNFTDKELEAQIQHFMELDRQKEETDQIVEESRYSGAEDQLDALIRAFKVIERMKIAKNTRVTFDDHTLITGKEATVNDVSTVIKDEGNRVMRTITKRVLGNFWRHFETADAETQTIDKAIDVLKANIKQLEKKNKEANERIGQLEVQKENLDNVLLKERAELIRQTRIVKDQAEELKAARVELAEEAEKLGHMAHDLEMKKNVISEQAQELSRAQRQLESQSDLTRELESKVKALESLSRQAPPQDPVEEPKASEKLPVATDTKQSFNKPERPSSRSRDAPKKKPAAKKEAAKQAVVQYKPDPAREARIREEAMKEAEENAFKKWSKEIEMQDMKLKAQLNMKQEKLNTQALQLEKKVTLYEKATQEIEKLKAELSEEKEMKSTLKKQLSVIQEDFDTLKVASARKQSEQAKAVTNSQRQPPGQAPPKQPQVTAVQPPAPETPIEVDKVDEEHVKEEPSLAEKEKMENSQDSIVTSEIISAMQPKIDSGIDDGSASRPASVDEALMRTRDAAIQVNSLAGTTEEAQSVHVAETGTQVKNVADVLAPRQVVSIPGLEIAGSPRQNTKTPEAMAITKQNTASPTRKSLTKDEPREHRQFTTASKRSLVQRQPSVVSPLPIVGHVRKDSQGTQVSKEQLARENPSTLYDGRSKNGDSTSNISPRVVITAQLTEPAVEVGDNITKLSKSSSKNPLLAEQEYQRQVQVQNHLNSQPRSNSNGGQFKATSVVRQPVLKPFVRAHASPPTFHPVLSDKTRVPLNRAKAAKGNGTWRGLKVEAMQPGYVNTAAFREYSEEDRRLVTQLIEAQTVQGDMEELQPSGGQAEPWPLRSPSPMIQKFDHSPSPPLQALNPPALHIRTTQQAAALNARDEHLDTYNEMIQKAYSSANQKVLLEKAKQSLDATELKLLILMLQMRGQFDAQGGPMVPKATQTVHRPLQPEISVTRRHTFDSGSQTHILGKVFEDQFFRRMTDDKPNMSSVSCQASDATIKIEHDRESIMDNTRRVLLANPRGDQYFSTDGTVNSAQAQVPSTPLVLLGKNMESTGSQSRFFVDTKKHVNFNSKAQNQLGKGFPRTKSQKKHSMRVNSDSPDAKASTVNAIETERSDVNSEMLLQQAFTSINATGGSVNDLNFGSQQASHPNQQIYTHINTSFTNQGRSGHDTGLLFPLEQVSESVDEINLHRFASPSKIFSGVERLQSEGVEQDVPQKLSMNVVNRGSKGSLGIFKKESAPDDLPLEYSQTHNHLENQPGFDDQQEFM